MSATPDREDSQESGTTTTGDVDAEGTTGAPAGTVTFEVLRYQPDQHDTPEFQEYEVEREEKMTVLDGLVKIRDEIDPSLAMRFECRMARCGSDALYINGKNRLACNTLVEDLDSPLRVEPLPHYEIIKDLVVDMSRFHEDMAAIEPWFQPADEPEPGEEYLQSPENRREIDVAADCIMCGACSSACSIVDTDTKFVGPAALTKVYRFAYDERENNKPERLEAVDDPHRLWMCHTQFNCTEVCPKNIPITKLIQRMKRDAAVETLRFWK